MKLMYRWARLLCTLITVCLPGARLARADDPESGQIAFVACARDDFGPQRGLYLLDLAGGAIQPLLADGARYAYPAWSPDGARLLFSAERDGELQIEVMALQSGDRRVLASGTMPAWSPDGRTIAFAAKVSQPGEQASRYALYLMDQDGANARRITDDAFVNAYEPAWSPDGSTLVFGARRGEDGGVDLYSITLPDGAPQPITDSPDVIERRPAFSPNGEYIAFSRDDGEHVDLYRIDPDGKNPALLVESQEGVRLYAPAWSPDGTRLVFQRQYVFSQVARAPVDGIYGFRPEDGDAELLITGGCQPAWRPGNR